MSWVTALDQFEDALRRQRAAFLSGGGEPVEGFVPPPGLGPLPPEQLPRARALLAQAEELVAQVQAHLVSTGRELALLDRLRPRTSGPAYVDQSM